MLEAIARRLTNTPLKRVRKVDTLMMDQVRKIFGDSNQQLILMVRG